MAPHHSQSSSSPQSLSTPSRSLTLQQLDKLVLQEEEGGRHADQPKGSTPGRSAKKEANKHTTTKGSSNHGSPSKLSKNNRPTPASSRRESFKTPLSSPIKSTGDTEREYPTRWGAGHDEAILIFQTSLVLLNRHLLHTLPFLQPFSANGWTPLSSHLKTLMRNLLAQHNVDFDLPAGKHSSFCPLPQEVIRAMEDAILKNASSSTTSSQSKAPTPRTSPLLLAMKSLPPTSRRSETGTTVPSKEGKSFNGRMSLGSPRAQSEKKYRPIFLPPKENLEIFSSSENEAERISFLGKKQKLEMGNKGISVTRKGHHGNGNGNGLGREDSSSDTDTDLPSPRFPFVPQRMAARKALEAFKRMDQARLEGAEEEDESIDELESTDKDKDHIPPQEEEDEEEDSTEEEGTDFEGISFPTYPRESESRRREGKEDEKRETMTGIGRNGPFTSTLLFKVERAGGKRAGENGPSLSILPPPASKKRKMIQPRPFTAAAAAVTVSTVGRIFIDLTQDSD